MSNKNTDNDNSQQLFSEDITKRLVKKILDDDIDTKQDLQSQNDDFNIEYETYSEEHEEQYDYDEYDDYDDDEEYYEEKPKRKQQKKLTKEKNSKQKTKENNNYRKNIEIYGKEFFDDDDYDDFDDEKGSLSFIGKIISTSVIIVLTISTAFLAFNLKYTKDQLDKAKEQIEELLDNKIATENKLMEDSLKSEIQSLKQENEMLKNNNLQNQEKETETTTKQQNTQSNNSNNSNNSNTTVNNSNNSSSTEYIVKEGDVIWNISKKVYGNGSHYQKILDANGLKEDSVLKPGQKLIIPSLN